MALLKRAEQITQQNRNRFVITHSRRGASGNGIPASNYYYRYPNNIYNQRIIPLQPRPARYDQVPARNVPHVVYLEEDQIGAVDDDTSDCSMTIPLIPDMGMRDVGSVEKKSSSSPTGVADFAPSKSKKGEGRRRCGRRHKKEKTVATRRRRKSRHSPSALSALNENVQENTVNPAVSNTSATKKLTSVTKSVPSTVLLSEKNVDNSVLLPTITLDEISTQAMPEIQEHEDEGNNKPFSSRKLDAQDENDVNNSSSFFINPLSYIFGAKEETSDGICSRDDNRLSNADRETFQTIPSEQEHDDDVSTISAVTSNQVTSNQVSFAETRSSAIVDLKLRKRKMEREFSRKAHKIPSVVTVGLPPQKPMSPM